MSGTIESRGGTVFLPSLSGGAGAEVAQAAVKQGYFWSPGSSANDERTLLHIRRIQPPFGVILTEDAEPISRAWSAHPHRICARVWAIDDGRTESNPEGVYRLLRDNPQAAASEMMGRYLAKRAEWKAKGLPLPPNDMLYLHAWNEPNAFVPYEQIVEGNIALMRLARQHEFPVMALNISVGNPHQLTAGGEPDWSSLESPALEQAIRLSRSVASAHGYWQVEGPHHEWRDDMGNLRQDYPYLAGRHHYWKLNAPLVIGECGVDGNIFNRNKNFGWQDYGLSPKQAAAQMRENHNALSPSVIAQCPFTAGFQGAEWEGYNTVPMMDAIEEWVKAERSGSVVNPPPQVGKFPKEFERAIPWIFQREGGFQSNPADPGNWYNGKLIGTNWGISAASWGGQYDIPNLTKEQAKEIYYKHYWLASGANKYPWPLDVIVLDTAVLHGVGAATAWLEQLGGEVDPLQFAAKRLKVYTGSKNWPVFGAGWVNRVADLLEFVGKQP